MKKKIDVVNFQIKLAGLIGIALIVFVIWKYLDMNQFEMYAKDQVPFSIKHPAEWDVVENQNGAAVLFYSPLENELDVFRENVNIVLQGDIQQGTLAQYTKLAIKQIEVVFKKNLEILESRPASLSGMPAHRLIYRGSNTSKPGEDANFKVMHVWTLHEGRAYQFTYFALEAQYDRYLPKVKSMLRSFKIKS